MKHFFANHEDQGLNERNPPPPDVAVLYAEDDDEWADLVRLWIRGTGLVMRRVANGRELRSFLDRCLTTPRCLLLDLGLGDEDGLKICDEIKARPSLQKIPIIVLTGHKKMLLPALNHQALYFIHKSHKANQELLAVIRSVYQDTAIGANCNTAQFSLWCCQ